jgi:hypothetical protein
MIEREKFNSSTAVCLPLFFNGLSIFASMRRMSSGSPRGRGFFNPGFARFFIPDACSVPALLCLSYVDLQGGLTL